MADDFPDLRDSSSFLDELEEEENKPAAPSPKGNTQTQTESSTGFLGMTPVQTFIISALFFFITSIVGFFLMLLAGKMVI